MSKDKQSICVTVRVRPLSSKQSEEDSRVCLKVDQTANLISLSGEKEAKDFYFDSVCDRVSQNQFFQRVGRKSTDYCMEGYNCTIFAYGQTGAGKTFTMMGDNPESKDYHNLRGLIPRTLEYLFESIEKQINDSGVEYMIKCSFIEIYNQQIIDLRGSSSNMSIREDLKKGVYIQGVTEEMISRSDQALQILRKGSKGRHVGSTCYNQNSSRSHSVFTMQIQSQKMNNGIKSTKSRHFHFIDLAGSEKTKKINGDRLKEGCSINKSLHVLSTVIGSLGQVSEGKTRHINYRDSKLTFLLKDSLGGNSKTHVIANISPSWVSSSQTRSTLIFARKVKMIKMNKVSINEDSSGNLQSLKSEIKRLKSENIFLRNGGVSINNSLAMAGDAPNPTNFKMMGVLQQYVDEELDKQTQMQLEMVKISNKNNYLQKGIKHFSENEKQLRMMIAIYEDKIKRVKQIQERLLKQAQQISSVEKIQLLKEYFQHERKNLIGEIDKLKNIGSSTGLVKTLLRDLKIVKDTNQQKEDDEAMINILTKNNQFLKQIQESIKELEPEVQEGKATATVLKENQDIKNKNQELSETIQKRNIEIIQTKDKLEETQNLLEQAIATQINLEKKMEEEIQLKSELQIQFSQEKERLELSVSEARQQNRSLISRQNQLQMVISEQNIQMSELKKDLAVLKEKQHFQEISFKQKYDLLNSEKSRLQEVVKEKVQQIQKIKGELIEFKNENERKIESLTEQIEEYKSKVTDLQLQFSQSEQQKCELKTKYEGNRQKYEIKEAEKDSQIAQLTQKIDSLKDQIHHATQELSKEHKNTNLWKQKCDSQMNQFENQKKKWEELNKQMLAMVNEKETSDSETQKKLTQAQFQLMQSHEKLADLKNQISKIQESYKNESQKSTEKFEDLQKQIQEKEFLEKGLQNEVSDLKKKIKQIDEELTTGRRKLENTQEQLEEKKTNEKKMNEELQKLKGKEKQLRIFINDLKNQNYAIKKNHEVETQSLRETIKRKQDDASAEQRQHLKIRQNLERSLNETKQMMENQIDVLKENQESIKKALEAHLKNKETKISELKELLNDNSEKITLRQSKISLLEDQYQNSLVKISEMQKEKETLSSELTIVKERASALEQQLNETQSQNIRVLEQNQNNFIEELDAKNAEIQKLQKQFQGAEIDMMKLGESLSEKNKAIQQLKGIQEQFRALQQVKLKIESQLTEVMKLYHESNENCNELQAKLVDRNQEIQQLQYQASVQIKQMSSEQIQKVKIVEKQKIDLEVLLDEKKVLLYEKQQLQQNLQMQIQEKIDKLRGNQTEIQDLTLKITEYSSKVEDLQAKISGLNTIREQLYNEKQNLEKQLHETRQKQRLLIEEIDNVTYDHENQQNYQEIRPQNKVKSAFQKFRSQMTNLNEQIDLWSKQNTVLKHAQQHNIQNLQQLHRVIQQKQTENVSMHKNCEQLEFKNNSLSNKIDSLNDKINEYAVKIQELEEQLENAKQKMAEKQEEIVELHSQMQILQQQKSKQIENLNNLYEKIKNDKQIVEKGMLQKREQTQMTRNALQTQIQQLEKNINHHRESLKKNEDNLATEAERNQELKKYIQEHNNHSIHLSRENEHLIKVLEESERRSHENLQEKERERIKVEHQMNALKEQLSAITMEASSWKNKMEEIEKDLKTANQRSEKYRKEYYRERDSNREFKQLLDNAHCQVESFKAQAQDKDRLYHQLLEKVSRNDVERKGLLTQDRKISELLEKSRIEVNEYRKKYDDQLKINNLLKQEIQKKELDNAIMKEKSEEYVKKNQNLIDSIRADYTSLQQNYKKKQTQCNELKKTLQSSSQKISQLEQQYQKVLDECRNAQKQYEQVKKEFLKSGSDERQLVFINKLKEENKILKRQLEKVDQQSNRDKAEIIRLKSEKRYGKEMGEVSVAEYNKKLMEIKYLQKQFDDLSMVFGNIEYNNKKSVGEGIRAGITDLQRELAKTRTQNMELKEELHSKCQKLNILQGHKQRSYKDNDDTLTRLRTKISKTASTYEGMRHSKEEDKSILQMKDPNRTGNWTSFNK